MDIKKIISQQLAQLKKLEQEDIDYNGALVETDIDTLVRPPYSSRRLVESQLTPLIKSLQQFGFLGGIYVEQKKLHVIDGWHRVELMHCLGYKAIPCYLITCNPEQEKRLYLHSNQQIASFILEDFGLNFKEFNLKEDFNIDPEDMLSNNGIQEKFCTKQKPERDGYAKLMTSLPVEAFDKLKAIKTDMGVKNLADAIINLINNYYETN